MVGIFSRNNVVQVESPLLRKERFLVVHRRQKSRQIDSRRVYFIFCFFSFPFVVCQTHFTFFFFLLLSVKRKKIVKKTFDQQLPIHLIYLRAGTSVAHITECPLISKEMNKHITSIIHAQQRALIPADRTQPEKKTKQNTAPSGFSSFFFQPNTQRYSLSECYITRQISSLFHCLFCARTKRNKKGNVGTHFTSFPLQTSRAIQVNIIRSIYGINKRLVTRVVQQISRLIFRQ